MIIYTLQLSKKLSISRVVEFQTSIASLPDPNTFVTNNPQSIIDTWKRRAMGWSKLNVNGSAKRNLLGAGGVIKTEQGDWTLGFTKFISIGDAKLAEAQVLFLGLKIANSLNIKNIEIETDCQQIYTLEEENISLSLCFF